MKQSKAERRAAKQTRTDKAYLLKLQQAEEAKRIARETSATIADLLALKRTLEGR